MEKHPLTPMTDPDLRRWLRRQTKGEVGLVPYAIVRQGPEAISRALDTEAAALRRLVVIDAVLDEDLLEIGRALRARRLVTGGSGIALGLPRNFREAGLLSSGRREFTPTAGRGVVLSGSCSNASQEQVGRYLEKHPGLLVNPSDLIEGKLTIDDALSFAITRSPDSPMIYSTADAGRVAETQSRWGREKVAQAVEDFFAALSRRLVAEGFVRLVVGGGETSGAVVTALDLAELQIGPEIDDGVPALATLGPLRLALKSGNFGSPNFYEKALAALGSP
jgi:uncharacterized protein YgbK (DUF1537 family)